MQEKLHTNHIKIKLHAAKKMRKRQDKTNKE